MSEHMYRKEQKSKSYTGSQGDIKTLDRHMGHDLDFSNGKCK